MYYCEPCRTERSWPATMAMSLGTCEICCNITQCNDYPSSLLPVPKSESIIDLDWVALQMRREADALAVARRPQSCYWCGLEGPGLYWLPSEEGVIEMAIWSCSGCIIKRGH